VAIGILALLVAAAVVAVVSYFVLTPVLAHAALGPAPAASASASAASASAASASASISSSLSQVGALHSC
jgi:hypothetical protein